MRLRTLLAVGLCLLLCGCITYRGFPEGYDKPLARGTPAPRTLYFSVEGSAMFAGPKAIRSVLAAEAPYDAVSPTEKVPASGDCLSVKITQNAPTIPALAFGYLSYATLTILPFWSTHDGATLLFTFYRDGAQVQSKEYVIERKSFWWILMLPLVWVNGMTPSEEETFAASARDFLTLISGKPPATPRN